MVRVDTGKNNGPERVTLCDIIANMIIDGELLSDSARKTMSPGESAVSAFISFIERRLNVTVVRELRKYTWGNPRLASAAELAVLLQDRHIAQSFQRMSQRADEPRLLRWNAVGFGESEHRSGGASFSIEENALYACVAESLERYLWSEKSDYFRKPMHGTEREVGSRTPIIPVARFAGFSCEQRAQNPKLFISPETSFLWIEAVSVITGQNVHVPAQVVSGYNDAQRTGVPAEPSIRPRITTGLATWRDVLGARLRGALEVIERDAYMIMWLNQLVLPRINLKDISARNAEVLRQIQSCERYGLRVHAIRMITDAPTYAICVVVEDTYTSSPKYSVGLKTGHSIADAILGALSEALRARWSTRHKVEQGTLWDEARPVSEIGHTERLVFWADAGRSHKLDFLIAGQETRFTPEEWESDSDATHLKRLVSWCKKTGYEMISVGLDTPSNNPLPWHVEMTIIPELQPMYLHESKHVLGGTRISTIPSMFGYPARAPYLDTPHPFA